MSFSGPLPRPRSGELIAADHIRALSEAIRDRTPLSSADIRVIPRTGGFTLEIIQRTSSQGACPHQWKPTIDSTEGDNHLISINSGYFMNQSPKVGEGSDTLESDPKPLLEMPKEGVSYCYLVAIFEPVMNASDTFVVNGTLTDLRIQSFTELMTDTDAAGVYTRYYRLFTKNGQVFTQDRFFNLGMIVTDDGTNTQTPLFLDSAASS